MYIFRSVVTAVGTRVTTAVRTWCTCSTFVNDRGAELEELEEKVPGLHS